MLGLIDADILAFRSCFANETGMYSVFDKTGRVLNYEPIRYKKDVLDFLGSIGKTEEEVDIRKERRIEPSGKVAATVKATVDYIVNSLDLADYHMWLSPDGPTFRHKIATIKPYKGNRKEENIPFHLPYCRQYLQEKYGAQIIEGYEADDALASEQGEGTIIISIDKDLKQIPGWHWNFVKEDAKKEYITEEEGLFRQYIQVLCGDSTDNIEGIPGIGMVGAERLLLTEFGGPTLDAVVLDEFCKDE